MDCQDINNKSSNSIPETLDRHYMSMIPAVTIIITTPPTPPTPPTPTPSLVPLSQKTLYFIYIFYLFFQLSLYGSYLKSTQP